MDRTSKKAGRLAAMCPQFGRWAFACLLLWGGCKSGGADSTPADSAPADGIFAVQLIAARSSDLPPCSESLAGTTAYVETPPSLLVCKGKAWTEIQCNLGSSGAVAYASATKTLWACVSGEWTQVTLPEGEQGPAGPTGPQGPAGAPGTLLSLVPEAAGPNCPNGGQRVDTGIDENGNNLLDASEVQRTAFVCNGATGPQGPAGQNGLTTLVRSAPEAAGDNCAAGGVRLTFGLDLDGNSILDSSEVTSTSHVCNGLSGSQGQPGESGVSTLVASEPEAAGPNCPTGGIKLSFGIDADGDQVLAQSEVNATSFVCNGAVLVIDGGAGPVIGDGQGAPCTRDYDCAVGLSCTDGVCCDHPCTGSCETCVLPGSIGTCAPVPAGQDPDSECGALTCGGLYAGWVDNVCYAYESSYFPASEVTCDGNGACQTAVELCSQQPLGEARLTCDPTCQAGDPATCTESIGPKCVNVDPGDVTCGYGPCVATSAMCAYGKPKVCQPNTSAARPEYDNGLDDDCDGIVDNLCLADVGEDNNDCAAVGPLPSVGSDQEVTVSDRNVYPPEDVDTYRIVARETDSTCANCGPIGLDEDYRLTIGLSVPAYGGTYRLCAAEGDCSMASTNCVQAAPGGTTTLVLGLDGGCIFTDAYEVYVLVEAQEATPVACAPYKLSYKLESGVCL